MRDRERPAHHDVLVLGGGPAGSALAIRLARLGIDVAIVERRPFPRSHVGICIADETTGLFDLLRVSERFLELQSWRRVVTAVRWGQPSERLVEQRGYHVDRGALDQLLLQQAKTEGATVYHPGQLAGEPIERTNGYDCTVTVAGRSRQIACRFFVDAAGRQRTLPGTRTKDGPPLLALYADWRLNTHPRFDGLIEAGEQAWAWFAQTGRDRAAISVLLDPRVARLSRDDLSSDYRQLLAGFPTLSESLDGSLCSPPRACDATSSHAIETVGGRQIRVGDAAMAIDPLSSQGVHQALLSGIQAAVVVNTILHRPGDAELARQFYRSKIRERSSRFAARARTEYARVISVCPNPFWLERGAGAEPSHSDAFRLKASPLPLDPALRVALAPNAAVGWAPIITGDFVERGLTVSHLNLSQPVAFVGGAKLRPLLEKLPLVLADVIELLGAQVEEPKAWDIARWLWQRGILVETAAASGRCQ